MSRLPIRAKFAAWAGLAMAVTLGTFATSTLYLLYRKQLREADGNIATERRELELLLPRHGPEAIEWKLNPDMGWTVFDGEGKLLKSDPIIPEEAAREALGKAGVVTHESGGRAWRVQGFPAGPGRTIVVGYDMVRVYHLLGDLVMVYAWVLPLVVVVAALSAWWATRLALTPLGSLAGAIAGIRSDHLEQRVPEPLSKDEIQELARMFNELLGRLERSFSQTKRFAADASHELRTPLTIMRAEIEKVIREPGLTRGQQATMVSLQEEVARLDRITEQLLLLARFDASQVPWEKASVDVSALVLEVCEDAELLASAAQVGLAGETTPGLILRADPHLLRRLFLNLFDNACHHNEPGGSVRWHLAAEGAQVVFRVSNSGPGIPPELRSRVFERFFRADPSRRTARGHGLGLALCREIVHLHGGTIALRETPGQGWTEFEIRLPSRGQPAEITSNS